VLGWAAGSAVSFAVGGALDVVGRRLETRQAEWVRERAAAQEWEGVVREVVVRNARLGLTAAALAGIPSGASAALPAPLLLDQQSPEEIAAWCARVDAALPGAEALVLTESVAAARRRTGLVAEAVSATDRLAELPDPVDPHRPAIDPAALDRVLSRLLPGAEAAEWTALEAAIAHARAAGDVIDARNRLDDLRYRIGAINRTTERRRVDAMVAAGQLQALRDDADAAALRAELAEVVAGRRPLDEELRAAAHQRCERIRLAANQRYVRREVVAGLRQLGYDVTEGLGTATPDTGALTLRRPDWDAHAVRMVIDADGGELRSAVVRTEAGSAGSAAADERREAEWCDSLDPLAAGLADNGVQARLRSWTAPGQRDVPVVAARRAERRPALERRRER
jgi:hypothetical protein